MEKTLPRNKHVVNVEKLIALALDEVVDATKQRTEFLAKQITEQLVLVMRDIKAGKL